VVEFGDGYAADDRLVAGLLLRPARAVLSEDDQRGTAQVGECGFPQPPGNGGQRRGGHGGDGFEQGLRLVDKPR